MVDNQGLKLILYTEEGRGALKHLAEAKFLSSITSRDVSYHRMRNGYVKIMIQAHITAAMLLMNYEIEAYWVHYKKSGFYKEYY